MKGIGELRNRGPLGYRSTSVRVDEDWERLLSLSAKS